MLSRTASSAHDILKTKIAVIHCSSFLVVVPSQQDVHTAMLAHVQHWLAFYADLATAGARRHGHLFQAPETERGTSFM